MTPGGIPPSTPPGCRIRGIPSGPAGLTLGDLAGFVGGAYDAGFPPESIVRFQPAGRLGALLRVLGLRPPHAVEVIAAAPPWRPT